MFLKAHFISPMVELTKLRRVMRLTVFILLTTCLTASASGYSQKVTLSEKDAPLEKVFKEVKKQTGFVFFYDEAWLVKASKVTIEVKNSSLEDALALCFKNQSLTFSIVGTTVVIKQQVAAPQAESDQMLTAPTINVKGVVRNEKGEAVEGISVIIKGTKRGTTTDINGNFSLGNLDKEDILVFTSVGTETYELKVGDKTQLFVTIKAKVNEISSVIISTGYQEVKRINLAGSVSSIKAADLYLNGTNTLEQALQGRLPGVVVINNDGLVGTRQKTIVRGVSTLTGTQDPVWVVDGVIQTDPLPFKTATLNGFGAITPDNFDFVRNFVGNAIAWLNPNDIEDITVLKDASATAIYGVRAANGVIVINTKKGKEGPASVSYSASAGFSQKVSYDKLELMNSKERVAVSKEIFDRGLLSTITNSNIGYAGALNDYLFGRSTYEEFNERVRNLETTNANWFDLLFRNPFNTNHTISLSGGNVNTKYYASFGYNLTNGTAIGNDSKGYTANLKIDTRFNRKLTASIRMSATEKSVNGFYRINPYSYAATTNRAISAFDSAGKPFFYTNRSGYLFNVSNELDNSVSSNKAISVNALLSVNYDVIKNVRFNTSFSVGQSVVNGKTSATERTEYIAILRNYDYGAYKTIDVPYKNSRIPIGGEYNQDDNNNLTWNWRNSLSYSNVFNLKHFLTVSFGQEASSSHYTGFSSTSYGYLPERGLAFVQLPTVVGTAGTNPNSLIPLMTRSLTDRTTNNMGLYGVVNYTYDNRYAFNFSVRSDASNRFGQFTGEKFNPVYAIGFRWNAMYEKWLANASWLSTFSVRTTFGYQRNFASSVSPDLIAKIPTGSQSQVIDLFTGESRLIVSSLPYGNLRWEQNATLNLGLDFGILKNRISGSFEYYIKKGTDLITTLPVPLEYGVLTMPVNGGNLTNRGIELSVNAAVVQTKNYSLSINLNTSKNYNKLTRAGVQNPNWRTATSGTLYVNGYPVSGFWAFDFKGIDPATGYPIINLEKDDTKDGTQDPTAYMKYVGKLNPDFTGGFGLNFRFKKLSVSSNIYLQIGGKKFLSPAYNLSSLTASSSLPNEYDNLSRQLLNRWTPQNTTAAFPGLPDSKVANFLLPDGKTFSNLYEMYNYSTARVVNASTLRVNNISFSYPFPYKWVSRMGVKNINIGAGIANAFAFVSKDFKGRDAEVATGGQPRTASYSFNMNINF